MAFEEIAREKICEKIDEILDRNFSQDKFKENFRVNFNKTLTENIDKMLDSNISKELFKEAVDKAVSDKFKKADYGNQSFNLSKAYNSVSQKEPPITLFPNPKTVEIWTF